MIIDSHTHHENRFGAIINASVIDFNPQEGCMYSLGLHPWDIKDSLEETFNNIAETATRHKQIVAIGETGLDALIDVPENIQLDLLKKHIELSELIGKPLILHCVRRSAEILKLYKQYSPRMPWIMHGFRSNANVLRPIIDDSDIYISIGEKFNQEAVKLIPDARLLIETDESTISIETIAAHVAMVRNQSPEEIMQITSYNASAIFKA